MALQQNIKCPLEDCNDSATSINKLKNHLEDHRIEHVFSYGFDHRMIVDSSTSKQDIIRKIIGAYK